MHGGRRLAERDGYAVIDCEACGWAHLDPLPDEAEALGACRPSSYYEDSDGWLETPARRRSGTAPR